MWVGSFRWRRARPAGARRGKSLAYFGALGPRAAGIALSLLALAACAVGPDFKPPPAPVGAGYAPEPRLAPTAAAPVAGGAAQSFVSGRDIPGEWWKVFHSR
jgi:hypothetical protein